MRSGWETLTVGDLAQINPESLGTRTPEDYAFNYIDLSMVDEGNIAYPKDKIIFKDASPRARRIVKNGDIIMSTVRPNLRGFARVEVDIPDLVCSTGFAVLRCKNEQTSEYLNQYILSDLIYRQIDELVVGSNYPAINNDDVHNLEVTIPVDLTEQRKIATILRTWDEAIEKLEKALELKRKVRTSLIAHTISNQTPNTPLKHFVTNVARAVPKPLEPYSSLGLRSHCKGTFQRFVEDFNRVEMDTLYQVKANDLIVNITFAWEGAVAIVKPEDEHCLVSHRFPTYEIDLKKAYPDFVRYIIQTRRFTELMGIISPGGAGRNRVLNKKDFLEQKVWLPDLKTQKFIGDLLCKAEEDINVTLKLLATYKSQKRGLMQKLLTGEWRVQVDKEAA